MKIPKKVISLVLSMSLCLSFTSIAFAENQQDTTSNKINEIAKNKAISKLCKMKQDVNFKIIMDNNEGTYSFTDSGIAKDKDKFRAKAEGFSAQETKTTSKSLSSISNELDYSDGKVRSTIDSTHATVSWDTNSAFGDMNLTNCYGDSHQFWTGNSPYSADSIDASDSFTLNYVGVSGTISMPSGLTVTGGNSSKSITWPQITNNYCYYHTFNGITGHAWAITSLDQSTSAVFRFGTRTFAPQASGSMSF